MAKRISKVCPECGKRTRLELESTIMCQNPNCEYLVNKDEVNLKDITSPDFIAVIDPNSCDVCYSTDVAKTRKGFACKECGHSWSQSDANFAKAMLPDKKSGMSALKRLLRGKE